MYLLIYSKKIRKIHDSSLDDSNSPLTVYHKNKGRDERGI